ncbi:MAG TPA: c-type cytochrome [Gemmatimonadaceae bacterium]|nr:c-type cytochrome [Gemmatimonadaceae bacterium]
MQIGSGRTIVGAMGTMVVCLLSVTSTAGQAVQDQRPPLAEEVHKNVQVLRGIPETQFMETMGFFSASLGANCTYCHVEESSGNWEKYADDNGHKQTARGMIRMVNTINRTYFGGRRVLTCYSCHRGNERPKVIPSLAEMYGAPPPEDPDEILDQAPRAPSADQVLDKYVQALGGAERLATVTSFVARGTYQGNAAVEKSPFELFAKAPGQRTTIAHGVNGDITTAYDGQSAWIAAPDTESPVPLLGLSGLELDAVKLDADLSFPAAVKQILTNWRVGYPTTIDDRDIQVVQGTSAGQSPVKLYFDKESGLLVRLVRYTDSPVGRNPTQIDYADYRDVAGTKMAFRWTITWLDGRSTIQLNDVRANVPIDAAKFTRPPAPTPTRRAGFLP